MKKSGEKHGNKGKKRKKRQRVESNDEESTGQSAERRENEIRGGEGRRAV